MVFGVGKVQMKFLHLLSTEASQSIAVHCFNEPPYSTADSFSAGGPIPQEDPPLKFRGWSGQMFEADTLLEPHVLQDECMVMNIRAMVLKLSFQSRTERTPKLIM